MTTTITTPTATPTPTLPADYTTDLTLTPNDRELLAWFLGNRTQCHELTREGINPAIVDAWAASPRISRQIAAVRSLNNLADEFINQGTRIDAMKAVSEDLRSATTSDQRLRAVNAYIRLCNATKRRSPNRTDDAPKPASTHPKPSAGPVLPPLPPIPRFVRPGSTPSQSIAAAPTTDPRTTASPAPVTAQTAPQPIHTNTSAAPTATHSLPLPVGSATGRGGRVFEAGEGRSPDAALVASVPTATSPSTSHSATSPHTPAPHTASTNSNASPAASSSPSPSPSIPSSSSSPRPPRPLRSISDSPTDPPRPTETPGAAPAGAWT